MKPIYDARSLNLAHLDPVRVSYHPKGIHAEAIRVTPDNIGKLSLEFEEELFYDGNKPYFSFMATRYNDSEPDGQEAPRSLTVYLGEWLVSLWDEIHVFKNGVFITTFTFDDEPPMEWRDKLTLNTPMNVPSVDYDFQPGGRGLEALHSYAARDAQLTAVTFGRQKFSVNERVCIEDTGEYGTVTVIDVEMGDGHRGIEVELDSTGQKYTFSPENLQSAPSGHSSTSGEITGPEGTQIMPRVIDDK